MKIYSKIFIGLTVLAMVSGCGIAHYGVAKLPPKSDMFITEMSEEQLTEIQVKKAGRIETTYQPVALLHTQRFVCMPCGAPGLEAAYRELESSLTKDLVAQAKKVGADAILNWSWSVFPVAMPSETNPAPPMGAMFGSKDNAVNWLVVEMRGIAVKTCKGGPACK